MQDPSSPIHTHTDLVGSLVSDTPAGVNIDHDRLLEMFTERRLGDHFGPQGVSIADARQDDKPLIAVNEGFLKLTGYSRAEVLGRNCRFLQGDDTDPVAVSYVRRAVATGRAAVVTLLNYRKDGTPFWNRLSMNPIRDSHGEVVYFVGVQSDVTALREIEREFADTIAQVEDVLGGPADRKREIRRELELR
ncbi:MAG: PAS domain-containing protein, partial [Planctomycetota bacterium]